MVRFDVTIIITVAGFCMCLLHEFKMLLHSLAKVPKLSKLHKKFLLANIPVLERASAANLLREALFGYHPQLSSDTTDECSQFTNPSSLYCLLLVAWPSMAPVCLCSTHEGWATKSSVLNHPTPSPEGLTGLDCDFI